MKHQKYSIRELMVEITRKCNMSCDHCLRGAAQNVNIKPEFITTMLEQVSQVSTLTITGGEPSLNVKGIRFLLNELKRLSVPVEAFYIATNGSKSSISPEFMQVCMDLYQYQELRGRWSEDIIMLQMSDDYFHDQELHGEVVDTLSMFSFFSVRNNNYNGGRGLIEQGRQEYGRELNIYPLSIDDDVVDGDVYLNALGNITSCCDMSYKTQHYKKLCSVQNFSEYIESIREEEYA